MKKSTLFISAALTTFMLAVVFGVASAYQKVVQVAGTTTNVAAQAQSADASNMTVTNTKNGMSIEQAANLASNVIGKSEVYSAEVTQLNGVDSYLVTFSSGDLVYVSLDGKIMSISKLPVNYIVNQTTSPNNSGGGNNSGTMSNYNNNGNSNNDGNYNNSNNNYNDNDDDHGNENEHEGGDD